MKDKLLILAGFVLGVIGVVFIASIAAVFGITQLGKDLRSEFFNGVWNGIGIGLGGVIGIAILNWLLGYLDKFNSQAAREKSGEPQ